MEEALTDPVVSARMARVKGRDTAPELAVRRLLHARGWRYRVNARPVPDLRRTGDIVFRRRRIVVLIDGCFWHACPAHYRPAHARAGFWDPKIARNVERDRETEKLWSEAGWTVLRFWEHERPVDVVARVEEVLAKA